MSRFRLHLLILAALGLVDEAKAAPVNTEFCFELALSYTDGAIGDQLTGSWTVAEGNRVQFVRESDGVTVNDVYVYGKPDACVALDGTNGTQRLDDAESYTVLLLGEARVDSLTTFNTVLVRSPTGGPVAATAVTGLTPSASRSYTYANGDTWTRIGPANASHILAAAVHALLLQPRIVDGETFELRNAGCGGSGTGSCFDESSEILWIGQPDRKFTTASILGLALLNFKNGHVDPARNDGANLDGCVTGGSVAGSLVNSKEYQSQAAYHGFASFFAAVVFNDDGTDDDCDFSNGIAVDWNADGDIGMPEPDETTVFSCEGSPAPNQSPPINDKDYLGQMCLATGVTLNRGTRYDWLRMLWDYHTDSVNGGVTVEDIFQLWADAEPDTWNPDGDVSDPDNPILRMYDATGQSSAFVLQASQNGVFH